MYVLLTPWSPGPPPSSRPTSRDACVAPPRSTSTTRWPDCWPTPVACRPPTCGTASPAASEGRPTQSWDRLAARLEVPADRTSGAGRRATGDDRTAVPVTGHGSVAASVVPIGTARPAVPTGGGRSPGSWPPRPRSSPWCSGCRCTTCTGRSTRCRSTPNLSSAERAALAAPGTTRVPLSAPGSGGQGSTPATIVLTAAGTGFVVNASDDGLAPLPADRTYQLWGVVGSKVISLGLLGVSTGHRALQRGRIARGVRLRHHRRGGRWRGGLDAPTGGGGQGPGLTRHEP